MDVVTGYAVVIEGERGSYSAWSPALPGCVATGRTLDEVKQRMREAIRGSPAGQSASSSQGRSAQLSLASRSTASTHSGVSGCVV